MANTKLPARLLDTSEVPNLNISGTGLGIGTTSTNALVNLVEDNSRSSKTGTAQGQIHISGGTDLSNGDVSGITFSTNTLTQVSSIIGNTITNSGSSLFFGTSNNYASGVTNTALLIDHNGNITKPTNCSFSARHGSTVSDFAINQYVQCPFNTEIYDNGGNLSSSGTFTAPVTGRYLLLATVRMGNYIDSSANYSRIIIATSNRNYQGTLIQNNTMFSSSTDPGFHTYHCHFICDMDANDSANVNFYQYQGAAQCDFQGDESFFAGELLG